MSSLAFGMSSLAFRQGDEVDGAKPSVQTYQCRITLHAMSPEMDLGFRTTPRHQCSAAST